MRGVGGILATYWWITLCDE